MGLRHRLDRLEGGEGSSRCPECELWPDGGYGRVFYTDGSSGPFPEEQEHCSGCGRPKFFFIEVVFDPDEEEEG